MSIYATAFTMAIETHDEHGSLHEIRVQFVPAHVTEEFAFLPPPRPIVEPAHLHPRAVVFTAYPHEKGTEGCEGQQYRAPLLVLSGEEYEAATFHSIMERLTVALEGWEP